MLVTNAQNGYNDAINELFNAFYNDLYYFALKTVKNDELALDITQEAFVEIIGQSGGQSGDGSLIDTKQSVIPH